MVNKIYWRRILVIESLGFIVLWPILFFLKSLAEPQDWFIKSVWAPWFMFASLEILSLISFAWNYKVYNIQKKEAFLK